MTVEPQRLLIGNESRMAEDGEYDIFGNLVDHAAPQHIPESEERKWAVGDHVEASTE